MSEFLLFKNKCGSNSPRESNWPSPASFTAQPMDFLSFSLSTSLFWKDNVAYFSTQSLEISHQFQLKELKNIEIDMSELSVLTKWDWRQTVRPTFSTVVGLQSGEVCEGLPGHATNETKQTFLKQNSVCCSRSSQKRKLSACGKRTPGPEIKTIDNS